MGNVRPAPPARFPLSVLARSPRYVEQSNEQLVVSYQAGDEKALAVLVEKNQGLVYTVVRHLVRRCKSLTIDDLASWGSMGLMRAARDYDATHSGHFERPASYATYARNWVHAYASRAANGDTTILTVTGKFAKGYLAPRYSRWVTYYGEEQGMDYEAAHEAARKKLEITRAAADSIRDLWRTRGTLSMDGVLNAHNELTLHEILPGDDGDKTREDQVDEARILRRIRALRPSLNERECAVLDDRLFGDATLEDVAKRFGLCRERIRQVEEKLLKRIKSIILGRGDPRDLPRVRKRRIRLAVPEAPKSAERLTGT
jgi:RNA polymerase sigma factor (sigma-70 family)